MQILVNRLPHRSWTIRALSILAQTHDQNALSDSLSTGSRDQLGAEKVLNHLILGLGASGCLTNLDGQVRARAGFMVAG